LEKKFRKLVQEKPDATFKELCSQIESKTGITVSHSTLCVELQKLNLTVKKLFQ
jgi:transposase